jgi:hypothetical protein
MKTPEEIENQARKYAFINPNQKPIDEEERYYIGAPAIGKYDGFIEGFKQCQQENIEVKYTLKDINDAIDFGFEMCKKYGDITKPERTTFIESVKK